MTNARGKGNTRRLTDMTIPPPVDNVWAPYRAGTRSESFLVDLLGHCRIHHAMWFDGGQIVDFVMTQQVRPDDGDDDWIDIVRIDCCHQEVHIHRMDADDKSNRKIIRPISSPEDLTQGLQEAEILIYDKWEENLGRWEHG